MIHLIWSSDKQTVEEEKPVKSVSKHLLASYRLMWFEPMGELTEAERTNAIVKNLVGSVSLVPPLFH